MPSPADARSDVERVLRIGALALLAVALWRLVAAATAGVPVHHATFDGAPSARTRDSLAAIARTGEEVSWSGKVTPLAAMAEGVRQPSPAVRLSVVADSAVAIGDALGLLDSLNAGGGTLTVAAGGEDDGAFTVAVGATRVALAADVAPAPGRLLVIGRASWESKFVVAALEEAGWEVDARLRLSDTMTVGQGTAVTPTLSRHSVVIALDPLTAAENAAALRFVREGGGLILSGRANGARALAPESRTFAGVDPFLALPLHPLAARTDALVLESRGAARAVTARREGSGRLIQSGYAETWRWRMEGEPGSLESHRRWWSRLVQLAMPTPAVPRTRSAADEGAPRAALVHALGSPSEAPRVTGRRGPSIPAWLGALILVLLVAEWGLRRTRGAP